MSKMNDSDLLLDEQARRGKDNINIKSKNCINKRSKGDMLRTASKLPQAILKISGYCKGKTHGQKHISYITRHGKLELYTSDGSVLKGLTAQKELINDWSNDFGTRKNSRDVAKIVLSSPENSCPNKLKNAVDNFLKNEFGETNEYAYALHTDTKKPHVHVVIKMVSYQGKKIDPRKNYIEKIRRGFAKCCRNEGILVEASRRYERGIAGKSKNTPVKQMRLNKHKNIEHDKRLNDQVYNKSNENNKLAVVPDRNKIIREEYIKAAIELHEKSLKADNNIMQTKLRKSAETLLDFAKKMPTETPFLNKIFDKLSNKNTQRTSITFKEYTEVLSKLDKYQLAAVKQINSHSICQYKSNLDIECDI